jgi:hypothetical protein
MLVHCCLQVGLESAGDHLGLRYGSMFRTLWAVGLLASGQVATIGLTYAGQLVMSGLLGMKVRACVCVCVRVCVCPPGSDWCGSFLFCGARIRGPRCCEPNLTGQTVCHGVRPAHIHSSLANKSSCLRWAWLHTTPHHTTPHHTTPVQCNPTQTNLFHSSCVTRRSNLLPTLILRASHAGVCGSAYGCHSPGCAHPHRHAGRHL